MQTLPNPQTTTIQIEDDRTGLSVETLKRAFLDNLFYIQGKFPAIATKNDNYCALAWTVRDRLLRRWLSTHETYLKQPVKVVGYLSAEFLLGPHLGNNLINLGIYDQVKQAMQELGLNLDDLLNQEEEPGLGNGGLGRLAACYLDSLATLEIPAIGYGIRYEFGIFDQDIRDGWQVEITDKWLRYGNPWEIARPEEAVEVKFGGHTEAYTDENGRYRVRWVPHQTVKGVPYDTPILGYHVNTANTLRLWTCEAPESFDFDAFNSGDYFGAVGAKVVSENISKVLYPNDEPEQGKQLRLEQQFFFVSCSLQDVLRNHLKAGRRLEDLPNFFALQMNDTHPAIAVAELMRLLVDEHLMDWDQAWSITQNTLAYTNHTLLPEALEKWALPLFGSLLPRHLQIIYEINARFLNEVRQKYPNDAWRVTRMSIIDETGPRYVRMANLATVGSHAVNGVAELHSELLKQTVLRDFAEMYPERFTNVTNGVTPRRFMVLSNPRLTELITRKIGDSWIKNLDELRRLEQFVDDPGFRNEWWQIKRAIKADLAAYIKQQNGIEVSPDSLFDIQAKRIHEYKRQHLNVLYIVTLYNRIKANPHIDITPRTFIFGGKAAPGYYMAKLIIKLINSVADVVNRDPDVRDRIKVVFLKDYNVKFAQRVYPAADLSEQISLAGKEASGTGNMKFAMNGALTIGTLDGANVEIREAVGADNFFLFGMVTDEVYAMKMRGYHPWDFYHNTPELKNAIDRISSGYFSPTDPHLFRPMMDSLLGQDQYMLLADYRSYVECQDRVSNAYRDRDHWTRMSILNVARMGKFSSDRSIRDYCNNIWHVKPVPVEIDDYVQTHA
ncbi:MAG TPA: glycogen/starch/alpha-glucan phosphorylase [Synechococcales cyanobacterium M55_K2018_004]|nr:glycogen/starch/alpha-glucan phosphorylase [Synechococcales cyanobacterium M55_K2018_004]